MYLKSCCLNTSLMTNFPMKQFFSKRSYLVESSVQATIRFQLSNVLDTGIFVEVKTRKRDSHIRQEEVAIVYKG